MSVRVKSLDARQFDLWWINGWRRQRPGKVSISSKAQNHKMNLADHKRWIAWIAQLRLMHPVPGVVLMAFSILISILCSAGPGTQAFAQSSGGGKGTVTGLKLPRYVSLKASRVNLRKGPGTKYPIAWVFRQAGLPVEIIAEFEAWRQVRDSEGTKGWVLRSLLSGRRTVQVTPWDANGKKERPRIALTTRASHSAPVVVLVEAGVIADVKSCDGQWCYVGISKFNGYLPQNKLWGVYKGEAVN